MHLQVVQQFAVKPGHHNAGQPGKATGFQPVIVRIQHSQKVHHHQGPVFFRHLNEGQLYPSPAFQRHGIVQNGTPQLDRGEIRVQQIALVVELAIAMAPPQGNGQLLFGVAFVQTVLGRPHDMKVAETFRIKPNAHVAVPLPHSGNGNLPCGGFLVDFH